jgi:hypothetical protein
MRPKALPEKSPDRTGSPRKGYPRQCAVVHECLMETATRHLAPIRRWRIGPNGATLNMQTVVETRHSSSSIEEQKYEQASF